MTAMLPRPTWTTGELLTALGVTTQHCDELTEERDGLTEELRVARETIAALQLQVRDARAAKR
jgi:plasmid maintenance system antidote protein VapI